MTGRGLLAGLVLIAVTNAAILGGVAWNRSAEEARVELTERELRLYDFREDEDSGLALRWDWQDWTSSWLDREKLRELGFDVHVPPDAPEAPDFYRNVTSREVFVVLEMDGEGWRRHLAEQEEAIRKCLRGDCPKDQYPDTPPEMREQLEAERRHGSRLVAIDAGRAPEALRRRYPDRSRYLILPALAGANLVQVEPNSLQGHLWGPRAREVHVPRPLRPVLDAILQEDRERGQDAEGPAVPRFRVTVAVGRRYEPWVVSVERIGGDFKTAAR